MTIDRAIEILDPTHREHYESIEVVEEACRMGMNALRRLKGTMNIQLDGGAVMPTRAHDEDAGLDLYAREGQVIPAGGSAVFDTGVHIELPPGTAGFLKSKSGLNVKHGLTSDGTIDEGYTGSIVVKLYNHGQRDFEIRRGDKISQLVIVQVLKPSLIVVDEITGGERGSNGFGSTGR